MGQELHIVGIDPGIENPGVAHIKRHNEKTRAVSVQCPRLRPDNNHKPWGDVARRCKEFCRLLDEMFPLAGLTPVHIVAIEEWNNWDNGGHRSGWKNAVMIGAIIGWAHSRGATVVMVRPDEPKKEHNATNKEGVCSAVCGHIDGLGDLLIASGNKGHHKSDAAAIAYQGMVKVFNKATRPARKRAKQ